MPAANWTASAILLTPRSAVGSGYIDLRELADHTGLAEATIRDALSRPPVPDASIPLGALARPAARIGGLASPEPMWSPEQVADYDKRKLAQADQTGSQRNPDLPTVTIEQAEQRGLASVETLAEELGLAPNTLRRWSRTYRRATADRPAFPPEVAMAAREVPNHRGRQHRLREREAVAEWVIAHSSSRGESAELVAS